MIETIVNIILFGLLGVVVYQDWKIRAVHVVIFPVLLACTLIIFLQMDLAWNLLILNAFFILSIVGLLFIYISMRMGKIVDFFSSYFGLGDLLFLLAITPLFGQRNFMLFIIAGIFLTVIIEYFLMKKREDKTNPLAGYLAIYVLTLKTVELITNTDLFYNDLI